MALYDNKLWLLSHIRNSFISTDDTGMCELVMVGEDLPKNLGSKLDCFPMSDDSDDDDDILEHQSYDIQWDMDFGVHRQRCNTAQRLEKMDQARKKAEKIKHIKWETPRELTAEEKKLIFPRKVLSQTDKEAPKKSLLSETLAKYPNLPHNPYMMYAKFDGSAQVGIPTRKYKIFLTMLPEEQRNYPMHICIIATAKIEDLIGLILLKCSAMYGDFQLHPVGHYGLHMTEEDGEVERDFPCLDAKENVARFGFECLGLVENTKQSSKNVSFQTTHVFLEPPSERHNENTLNKFHMEEKQLSDNLALMKVHTTAMEAPLYQSYRVLIINKVLAKSEINLGISGEKIEIDPVQHKNSKFWARQKAITYSMDSVAWCEITDKPKSGRATFKLVYSLSHVSNQPEMSMGPSVSGKNSPSLQASASFKHHEFEADQHVAEEIVRKINYILELRSSSSRKEFLASKGKKLHRRKSFHLGSSKHS